jgi:hypothetical protein
MKICRFCQHTQEDGNNCEACGAPFSADKLDFSSGLDEMTSGVSEPASAFPETNSEFAPAPEIEPAAPVEAGAAFAPIAPVASAPASEEPVSEAPDLQNPVTPSEEVAPAEPQSEGKTAPRAQFGMKDGQPRGIMYQATGPKETVYDPKLARAVNSNGTKMNFVGARPKNNTSNPVAVVESPAYDKTAFGGIDTLVNISALVNLAMMFCMCGTNIIPFILSMIAYSKMKKVKTATASNPDSTAATAKTLAIVADVLLAIWGLIILIAILVV